MLKKIFESEVLFTGYYGQLNTGDDAFIEVSAWGAKKYWNKYNNIYLARNCNLPVTKNERRGYPFSIPKTYQLQNKILISATKYLISAGGSTIHSELYKNDIKYLGIKEKKRKSTLKIGGIGVSIGPFKNIKDEKSVIEYLKNIDFLAVRDQESFNFVQQLDLPYMPVNAFDLAALLPNIYEIKEKRIKKNNKKTIGISICPVESISGINIEEENIRNEKMKRMLNYLDENENIHFKFFIINGHNKYGDFRLTKEIIERVAPKSYEVVDYNRNTNFIWDEISKCDFFIATRLHAAIFACYSKTPFMLNEYHRKCKDFLDDINHKLEYRLYNNDYDEVEKADMILKILNNDLDYLHPSQREAMAKRSELNFIGIDV